VRRRIKFWHELCTIVNRKITARSVIGTSMTKLQRTHITLYALNRFGSLLMKHGAERLPLIHTNYRNNSSACWPLRPPKLNRFANAMLSLPRVVPAHEPECCTPTLMLKKLLEPLDQLQCLASLEHFLCSLLLLRRESWKLRALSSPASRLADISKVCDPEPLVILLYQPGPKTSPPCSRRLPPSMTSLEV